MLRRLCLLTLVFTAGTAYAEAEAPSPLPSFDAKSGAPIVLESIIAPDTLEFIESVADTKIYDMARIVARVEYRNGQGFCTGFRVAETLFITNYHCWEVARCDLQFRMGFEEGLASEQQETFTCVEVLAKLERLDYALYRVESQNPDADLDFPVATLSGKPLTLKMPLLVPGHPAARHKQVDISKQCVLTRAVPYRFYDRENIQHQCDTLGGSSGSPVMDRETGEVVGLHWGATGGTPSNHAIPMELILKHLEETVPEAYEELTIEP